MAGLLDAIIGGTPNAYVGNNFPVGMPPAADGGADPLDKLRKLLMLNDAGGGSTDLPAPPAMPPPPLTDIGATRRAPQGPSIDETVLSGMGGGAAPAPLDLSPPPAAAAPAKSRGLLGDGLLSAIIPDADARGRFAAALGAGLSNVKGPGGAAQFAQGMGGGLKGATAFDKDRDVMGLKRLIAGDEANARSIRNKYLTALTAKAGASTNPDGTPTRRPTQWDDPRFRFDKARTAISNAHRDIDNKYVNDPRARRFATPEEKKALAEEIKREKEDVSRYLQERYQVQDDSSPPASGRRRGAAATTGPAPAEIGFKGNGTKGDPYEPVSKADYDEIPTGAYYRHPTRGLVIKG